MTSQDDSPLTIASVLRPTLSEAIGAWQRLLRAAEEQALRRSEDPGRGDEAFWAARAAGFRPGASESEELPYLLSLARPADEWLDIGAGAGRLAIPLSRAVRRLVATDTSEVMRAALRDAAAASGTSVEVHAAHWPADEASLPVVDVTLAANMLYAEHDPLTFVEAMERHSRRLCVVTLADRPQRTPDPAVWEELHGEPLAVLPGSREFIALLGASGRRFDVATFPVPPATPPSPDALAAQAWRYGLREDSPRMPAFRAIAARRLGDASLPWRSGRSSTVVISWEPSPAALPARSSTLEP